MKVADPVAALEERCAEWEQRCCRLEQELKAIRDAHQPRELAFSANPQPMCIVRLVDGVFVEMNASCASLLGWGQGELIGRRSSDTVMSLEAWLRLNLMLQRSDGRQRVELHLNRRDGSVLPLVTTLVPITLHDEAHLLCMAMDVSELRESQRQRRSEWQLRQVLEDAEDMIAIQSLSGRFLYYNGSPQFGLSRDQVLDREPSEVFQPAMAELFMLRLKEVVAGGHSVAFETRRLTDGQELAISVQMSPIRDVHGRIESVISIGRNITRAVHAHDLIHLLHQMATALGAAATVEQGVEHIVEALIALPGVTAAIIYLAHRGADGLFRLQAVDARGIKLPQSDQRTIKAPDLFERKLPYHGSATDAPLRPNGFDVSPREQPIVMVPVQAEGQLVALLTVAGKAPLPPNANDFIEAIAAQSGSLIRRLQTQARLRESETNYRRIFQAAANLMTSVRDDGIFVDTNTRIERVLGYSRDEILGKHFLMLFPADEHAHTLAHLAQAFVDGWMPRAEFRMLRKDGREIHAVISTSILDASPHEPRRTICIIDDVTERRQAEARLRASLNEKEVLLREIHHRVKNNLQVLISLMNLQMQHADRGDHAQGLHEIQQRAMAMALVHEKLYRSDHLAGIELGSYVEELVTHLVRAHHTPADLRVEVLADQVCLPLDQATPCALAITELITNSFKYAFDADVVAPALRIEARREANDCCICVSDNGVGLPPSLDWETSDSLGLRLIGMLIRYQLNGDVELLPGPGTAFRLRFPIVNHISQGEPE